VSKAGKAGKIGKVGKAAQAQRRDQKNNTEKARRTSSTVWLQEMQSRLEVAGWSGSLLSQANHRKSKGLLKYNKLEIMEKFVGSFDEMMSEVCDMKSEGDGLRGDNLRLKARNRELCDEITRLNRML
jgi:hypothetical protein